MKRFPVSYWAIALVIAMAIGPAAGGDLRLFVGGQVDAAGEFDIYMMAPDGSGLQNLTGGIAGDCSYPTLSPNGRWLAFKHGTANYAIMDMTTRTVAYEWSAGGVDLCAGADWVDSMRLVYTSNHAGLNVRNRDGSGLVYLGAPKAWEKTTPRVSPDGQTIAGVFGDEYNDTAMDLYRKAVSSIGVNTNWTAVPSVSESEFCPVWGLDNDTIYHTHTVSGQHEVASVKVSTGVRTVLQAPLAGYDVALYDIHPQTGDLLLAKWVGGTTGTASLYTKHLADNSEAVLLASWYNLHGAQYGEIPEPATLAMLAAGALAVWRRRRA